jgi:hypothetical protein
MKTLFVAKVTIILQKEGEKQFLYPSVRKTKFFLNNKANTYLKNDVLVTLRVAYRDGAENSGTYKSIGDLHWAYQAFITDYLND